MRKYHCKKISGQEYEIEGMINEFFENNQDINIVDILQVFQYREYCVILFIYESAVLSPGNEEKNISNTAFRPHE
jgi:hypothetical protein